jgi:hypothetical protein
MSLELCINLILGLLQKKQLRNDSRWQEGHAVILARSIHILPTVAAGVQGLYPRYAGQLRSLE